MTSKAKILASTVSTGAVLADGAVAISDISGLQTALDNTTAGAAATTTVGGDLKLYEGTDNGTNYVALKSPDTLAANVTYTLPTADGTNGQVLATNGTGTLSWSSASGSSQWTTSGSDIYYNTGKVTIGGATPLGTFNLVGLTRPSGPVTYTSTAGNGNAQSGLNWYQDNNANYEYYLDLFATATAESPWGGSNIRMLTTPVGSATAVERARITRTGNMLVGTTTNNASGGVLQVSNGITFPATQSASSDANTLDDYEEGTWTPVVGGVTLTGAGRYTKVGRLVSISFANQSGIPALAVGARMDCTGIPFGVVAGAWANTAIPSIGWNNASLSFLDELACGRLDPTNTISMFNRGTEATTTADSWGMSLVYYTS